MTTSAWSTGGDYGQDEGGRTPPLSLEEEEHPVVSHPQGPPAAARAVVYCRQLSGIVPAKPRVRSLPPWRCCNQRPSVRRSAAWQLL